MKCAKRQNGDLEPNMLTDEKPVETDHRVTDVIGMPESSNRSRSCVQH
jgi:hypothetical protein